MNFKRILNRMAPKKRLARMAERTFRSILTKHYPDIRFYGEEPDDADLWVRGTGYWGIDRVLFDRDTGGVRMWYTHSHDCEFESIKEFREWVARQAAAGNNFERKEAPNENSVEARSGRVG